MYGQIMQTGYQKKVGVVIINIWQSRLQSKENYKRWRDQLLYKIQGV